MPRMIFVNLPVADLPRAMRLYEAVGFTNEPRFSDDSAACMVWSDTVFVMLLSHAKWKTFTDRPIPAAGSSEVSLAINLVTREDVDRITETACTAGWSIDANPPQDHGFMYQRTMIDADGHVWEPFWMAPEVAGTED